MIISPLLVALIVVSAAVITRRAGLFETRLARTARRGLRPAVAAADAELAP